MKLAEVVGEYVTHKQLKAPSLHDHYSLRRYYGPLRHPGRPALSLAGFRLGSFSPPPRASRVNTPLLCPHASANTPVLLLGAFATRFPNRRRPSPIPNWLGSHIARFEAYSAFNFHSGLRAH
jgi:hypothetical protein